MVILAVGLLESVLVLMLSVAFFLTSGDSQYVNPETTLDFLRQ